MGYQMLAVTIGWQVYELTDSAFDLGLVGLIQFVPAVVLTLLIGHAADRYDRRLIVRGAQSTYALAAVILIAALASGHLSRDLLFGVVFLIGCARAFEMPTAHALAPVLVPPAMISRAVAAWTSANQIAVICGPALGGLIYALSPMLVGSVCLIFFTISITFVTLVQVGTRAAAIASRRPSHRCWPVSNIIRTPAPAAWRDHARPVRGAARRRHRAAADLCPRHSQRRADRSRPAALGAGRRRA